MSNFDAFVSMLTDAGYKFEVEHDAICRFMRDRHEAFDMHGVIAVTVEGTFYEFLYAEFTPEGDLLAISSHVSYCPDETDAIRRCTLPVTPKGEKP